MSGVVYAVKNKSPADAGLCYYDAVSIMHSG